MKKPPVIGPALRVPESSCTKCGENMNGTAGIGNDTTPDPGDTAVCFYCGHIMVFGEDLKLRDPTGKEMIEIASDPNVIWFNENREKILNKK